MGHCCLYQRSLKIFVNDKYSVLTPELFVLVKTELFVLVKSFDDKTYVCETFYKQLLKGKTPFRRSMQ